MIGSSIGVYGTISPLSVATSGTRSQYVIDGGPAVSYTTSPTKDTQYGFRLFQSSSLNPGDHTLEVTNESDGGWLWLDYFIVTTANTTGASGMNSVASMTGNLTATAPVASPPPAASITPQLSLGIPDSNGSQPKTVTRVVAGASNDVNPAPTATPSPLDSFSGARASNHPPAGAIIGGTLGGVLGILVLIALIWCLRRKLADRFADEAATIPSSNPPLTTPPNGRNFPRPNQVRGSLVVAPPDPLGGPLRQNMSQVHNRYGSNTSGVYPFVPGAVAEPQFQQGPSPGARMSTQQSYRPSSQAGLPSPGLSQGVVNPALAQTHQQEMSLGVGFYPPVISAAALSNRVSAQSLRQTYYGYPEAGSRAVVDSPPAYAGYPHSGVMITTNREKW